MVFCTGCAGCGSVELGRKLCALCDGYCSNSKLCALCEGYCSNSKLCVLCEVYCSNSKLCALCEGYCSNSKLCALCEGYCSNLCYTISTGLVKLHVDKFGSVREEMCQLSAFCYREKDRTFPFASNY